MIPINHQHPKRQIRAISIITQTIVAIVAIQITIIIRREAELNR